MENCYRCHQGIAETEGQIELYRLSPFEDVPMSMVTVHAECIADEVADGSIRREPSLGGCAYVHAE